MNRSKCGGALLIIIIRVLFTGLDIDPCDEGLLCVMVRTTEDGNGGGITFEGGLVRREIY